MKWAKQSDPEPDEKPFRLPLPREWTDADRKQAIAALTANGFKLMKGYSSWDGDVYWVYPPSAAE